MEWQVVRSEVVVAAKPSGLWTVVTDWLTGPVLLKFEATDAQWSYTAGASCTADGDYASALDAGASILPVAPRGALIAKFGGSSAGTKDGDLVLVGRRCVYAFTRPGAPLYLTINDDPKAMGDNVGSVQVDIACCANAFLYAAAQPAGPPALGLLSSPPIGTGAPAGT